MPTHKNCKLEGPGKSPQKIWLYIILVAFFLASCMPVAKDVFPYSPIATTRTPFLPIIPSATDFQPLPPTLAATALPSPTRQMVSTPTPALFDFFTIDLGDPQKRVIIKITPPSHNFNGGKPVEISFFPGQTCVFGDHRGCVFAYRGDRGANIMLVSVHSGVGGEAQTLRHALEGTGVNQAAYTLKQIHANLAALEDASVQITQGKTTFGGLIVTHAGRVPASKLDGYFNSQLDQAISYAAAIDPDLQTAVNPLTSELIIETCGWKSKEEPWSKGVTSTTASVYLIVIRKAH